MKKRISGLSEAALSKFVSRAKRALRLAGEVNIMVTGDAELRRLNRRFRAKDRETDVLSFPALRRLSNGLAGDIAISADIASDNARHLGHSPAEEIKILALHGILHLAGYDHDRDQGQMTRKEARLRRAFGLSMSLTERSGARVGKTLTAKHAENPQRSRRKTPDQRFKRVPR